MKNLFLTLTISAILFLLYFTLENPVLLLLTSGFFTIFLLVLIGVIFGSYKLEEGFTDFFIGDGGGYSLSRLQAVAWAIIIIGYQISVILLLLNKGTFKSYEIVFSEETLWLLGLSLGSYVSVKGITIEKISKNPELLKSKKPKLLDFISAENGLDFSKFQMLIWTIVGLFIFESKCYFYLDALNQSTGEAISKLFNTHYDQMSEDKQNSSTEPLPYLPWSFIVLMGLSQGAYVGKKLLPSFKLQELLEVRQGELQMEKDNLRVKKRLLEDIVSASSAKNLTDLDKLSLKNLATEIKLANEKVQDISNDISKIKIYRS